MTTIVLQTDGSILGYEGRPGDVTSQPIALRRALRSPLEMWWALITSMCITASVVVVLWRCARRDQVEAPGAGFCRESTRWLSARSIIEQAVIAAALACLNGAGAVATWNNAHVRQQACRVGIVDKSWGSTFRDESGNVRFRLGQLATGEHLVRVMWLPWLPTFVEIWSPVIASVSVTLLALVVVPVCPVSRSRRGTPKTASDVAKRRSPFRLARWATIAAALIGLNVAGALYRVFPQPGEETPSPSVFAELAMVLDKQGGLLRARFGGTGSIGCLRHRPTAAASVRPRRTTSRCRATSSIRRAVRWTRSCTGETAALSPMRGMLDLWICCFLGRT